MPQGHQCAPVLPPGALGGQGPPPDLPEGLWPAISASTAVGGLRRIAIRALHQGPASSGAAREFTRQTLQGWDLRDLSQDAAVIVSELVTNAGRHGGRGCMNSTAHARVELILWRLSGHLVCVVTDLGSEPPVPAVPDMSAEAGRGLQVVQALAATWGWARLDLHRKAVWAALRLPGPDADGPRQGGAW